MVPLSMGEGLNSGTILVKSHWGGTKEKETKTRRKRKESTIGEGANFSRENGKNGYAKHRGGKRRAPPKK